MLADGADWGAQLDPFSSYAARPDCLDWLFHIDSEIPDDSQTLSTAIIDPYLARTHTDGRLSCDLTPVLPCRRHLSHLGFSLSLRCTYPLSVFGWCGCFAALVLVALHLRSLARLNGSARRHFYSCTCSTLLHGRKNVSYGQRRSLGDEMRATGQLRARLKIICNLLKPRVTHIYIHF